jgi:hypothetical protein
VFDPSVREAAYADRDPDPKIVEEEELGDAGSEDLSQEDGDQERTLTQEMHRNSAEQDHGGAAPQ